MFLVSVVQLQLRFTCRGSVRTLLADRANPNPPLIFPPQAVAIKSYYGS